MKVFSLLRFSVTVLLLGLLVQSCGDGKIDPVDKGVSAYSHEISTKWNLLFLEVERHAAGFRPGPAPRSLGYMGFAAYEACVPGMPDYNSLAHLYAGLSIPAAEGGEYHWPSVVNAVYGYLMPRFLGGVSNDLKQKMADMEASNESAFQAAVSADVFQRSKKRGQDVAEAVWQWSTTDSYGHDAFKDPFGNYDWQANYKKPGDWVATTPGPGKGMFPYWGKVRVWALPEDEKISRPPLPYSEATTSAMYAQALEVYAQNTPVQSDDSEWIGEFWSDDLLDLTFSPPPRWIAIANQVLDNEDSNLETALETYAKIGMAINDAGVGCWNSKYYYNVERPITYIRRLIDPSWDTNLENPITGENSLTPSFPAYPSGHATFGAAGAEALASVFGYAYSMTDRCHESRAEFIGTPRTFGSFYEMAQENGWSRVPLGVHFRMDSEEGVRYGTVIGRHVNDLPWKK
ncbi:MAG: vanadium-dependent haloperoxidase [Saprospiraceae bacterium]|nr:vanadium-dependent haloperoxidase [Saprospiraceae bacterium]